MALLNGVHLIGDPHLGKKFEVGVPLARRGEREASQLAHFEAELNVECDVSIMVGDLFDHPYVGYATVQTVADVYRKVVSRNPDRLFVAMAGNHDMPRNIANVGAFDDFRDRLDGRFKNLYILNEPRIIKGVACFPWEWDKRADQQVLDFTPRSDVVAAVGHWDLAEIKGKDTHLAPVDAIRKTFGEIPLYSGHYHVAGDYPVAGSIVHCTGSLEPYTHGEDPNGELYVTLSRTDALDQSGDLVNKNVRIRRKRGEDMPDIDCLSLTYIYEDEGVDEGVMPGEKQQPKDWNALVAKKLANRDPRVQEFIKDRINVEGAQE